MKMDNYDIIISPIVTEKSTIVSEHNIYQFKVRRDANKKQIKSAIETVFGVKVLSVNTLNMEGKVKKFKGQIGKRSSFKKAMIRLVEGDTIDIAAEV